MMNAVDATSGVHRTQTTTAARSCDGIETVSMPVFFLLTTTKTKTILKIKR